jgi:XapX domain-containing protein
MRKFLLSLTVALVVGALYRILRRQSPSTLYPQAGPR